MKRKSTFFSHAAWADRRLLQKLHTIYANWAKVTDYVTQPIDSPKIAPVYLLFPAQGAGCARRFSVPPYRRSYFTTS